LLARETLRPRGGQARYHQLRNAQVIPMIFARGFFAATMKKSARHT
jgi:hypothetical protein